MLMRYLYILQNKQNKFYGIPLNTQTEREHAHNQITQHMKSPDTFHFNSFSKKTA